MSSLAAAVALLEAERDRLLERLAAAQAREHDIARRMYRRGYRAGRAAKRRGAPALSNPERRSRGETRALTNG